MRDFSNFKPQNEENLQEFPKGWHKARIIQAEEVDKDGNVNLRLTLKNADYFRTFVLPVAGVNWSLTREQIVGEELYRLGQAALKSARFSFKELEGKIVGFLVRSQWNNWDFLEACNFVSADRVSVYAENYVDPEPTAKQLAGAAEYKARQAAKASQGTGGYNPHPAGYSSAPHPANDPGASPWEDEDGY